MSEVIWIGPCGKFGLSTGFCFMDAWCGFRHLKDPMSNETPHRMSGNSANLKFEHRDVPLNGALGRSAN